MEQQNVITNTLRPVVDDILINQVPLGPELIPSGGWQTVPLGPMNDFESLGDYGFSGEVEDEHDDYVITNNAMVWKSNTTYRLRVKIDITAGTFDGKIGCYFWQAVGGAPCYYSGATKEGYNTFYATSVCDDNDDGVFFFSFEPDGVGAYSVIMSSISVREVLV